MRDRRLARAVWASAFVALAGGCQFRIGAASPTDAAIPRLDAAIPRPDGSLADSALVDLLVSVPADLSTTGGGPDLSAPDLTTLPAPVLAGTKVAGPATVNLTLEGTADWMHLGLNVAGDVNRKLSGGSQITQSANAALTQYNRYATTFSWSDGSPTANATTTPNGVYVLGAGKGFTISAPADLTPRTLRLYLNVGGTAALTAHVSDGSSPDYTDTQTGANNGATWLYTVRYVAASAGQNLSVTWQLSSGTGVSLLAATLQ